MFAAFAFLLMGIILPILLLFPRKRGKIKGYLPHYLRILLNSIVIFLFVHTFTWVIPYRASSGSIETNASYEYSFEDVLKVRNYVILRLNELCRELERDSGQIIADNLDARIQEALRKASNEFPNLKGGYAPIKPAICSEILNILSIGGYNYPYTMEPTVPRNLPPCTYCVCAAHEWVHNKGYYREIDGVYISMLALTQSGDDVLEYFALYQFLDKFLDSMLLSSLPENLSYDELMDIEMEMEDPLETDFFFRDIYYFMENKIEYNAWDNDYETLGISSPGWTVQDKINQKSSYQYAGPLLLNYYLGLCE